MKHNRTIGFTLIELLVVVAVLGILAGGILIALNITGTVGKASLTKAKRFAASLENGLAVDQVGKWSFEEGAVTTFKDTSGYTNNGLCVVASCPTWKTATDCDLGFGGCLEFDPTPPADRVTISSLPTIGNGPATVMGWFYRQSDTSPLEGLVTFTSTLDGLYTDSGNWAYYNGGSPLSTNVKAKLKVWTHFAFIRASDNTLKLYVNGELRVSDSSAVSYSSPVTIGTGGALGIFGFTGRIDEVQIYNEALTLSQIYKLYVKGLPRHRLANNKNPMLSSQTVN